MGSNYFQLTIYRGYLINFFAIFKTDGHLKVITIPKYLNSHLSPTELVHHTK